MNYFSNGIFSGNILVVRKPGSRKTTLVQKLGMNNFFCDIKRAEWLSKMLLSERRETEIEAIFRWKTEFHYSQTVDELDDAIEDFIRLYSNNSPSIEETEKSVKVHNDYVGEASFFGDSFLIN